MPARTAPILLVCLTMLCLPASAASPFTTERQVTRIADGVYVIRHQDPAPGWVHGNTTVIIGERQVLVVDSTQMASSAKEDIAQIRQWTDKPVAYVLNTHWHTDHNGGNHEYLAAFPGATIVAHTETRAMEDRYNPGVAASIVKTADQMSASLKKQLETGKGSDGHELTAAEKAQIPARQDQVKQLYVEARDFVYQSPTLTFDDGFNVDLGGREVEVRHFGRANTGGDAEVYLPGEKVLITGDVLVSPIPYAFDGYPSEWARTLDVLDKLDADTIVPGHGEVMHDKTFLHDVRDLMRSVVEQVDEQFRKNPDATLEEVKKGLDVKAYRRKLAGDDVASQRFFDYAVGSSLIELAYNERKAR